MVNNSTNPNKINNHLSPQIIEHKIVNDMKQFCFCFLMVCLFVCLLWFSLRRIFNFINDHLHPSQPPPQVLRFTDTYPRQGFTWSFLNLSGISCPYKSDKSHYNWKIDESDDKHHLLNIPSS